MYAIEEHTQRVNKVEFTTFEREVDEGNVLLEAEAGTTGYAGDDCKACGGEGKGGKAACRGARAFLRIDQIAGNILFSPVTDEGGETTGIVICACGDDALAAIMRALEFCQRALTDQILERDE